MMKTVSALLLFFTVHSTALKMEKKIKISPPINDTTYLIQLLRPDELALAKLDEEVEAAKKNEDTMNGMHRRLKKHLSELYRQKIPDPETWKILDFGSGVGATTRDLRDRFPGAQVTGFDFNEHVVARAQQETKYNDENIEFTHALPTEKYDLVVCENMLQPESGKEMLAQINALLSYVEKEGVLWVGFKTETEHRMLKNGIYYLLNRQHRPEIHISRDPKTKPKHDGFLETIPKEIIEEVKAKGGELPEDVIEEMKRNSGGEVPLQLLDQIKAAINKPAHVAGPDEDIEYMPYLFVQNVYPYQ